MGRIRAAIPIGTFENAVVTGTTKESMFRLESRKYSSLVGLGTLMSHIPGRL